MTRKWGWLRKHKVLVGIVIAVAFTLTLSVFTSRQASPEFPAHTEGYAGTSTNTGTLSPAWAFGVGTAWSIPSSPEEGNRGTPSVLIEGTTMYVATVNAHGYLRVSAYDVSSAQPSETWVSDGQNIELHNTFNTPPIVSTGDSLAVGSIVLSKETGLQLKAPWDDDTAMAFGDGVLVTCSGYETCSGWTAQSGSWTRIWKSITTKQRRNDDTLKKNRSGIVGSGDEASFLVPVDTAVNPQLVNVHTGEVLTLGQEGRLEIDASVRDLHMVADGVMLERAHGQVELYDASGTLTKISRATEQPWMPTADGRLPTLAELNTFFTDGKATWTTGRVTIEGKDCSTFTLAPTADLPPRSASGVTGLSSHYSRALNACPFRPSELRASADGSAALVLGREGTVVSGYVLDMSGGRVHRSTTLLQAKGLAWAFDDLLILTTEQGIVALTPASS